MADMYIDQQGKIVEVIDRGRDIHRGLRMCKHCIYNINRECYETRLGPPEVSCGVYGYFREVKDG